MGSAAGCDCRSTHARRPRPGGRPAGPGRICTQLEGICKPHALATQRTMKGVRAEVEGEQLKLAARKFSRATQLFDSTVSEISAVQRPPADSVKLEKWYVDLGHQESYLKAITAQLGSGHTISPSGSRRGL